MKLADRLSALPTTSFRSCAFDCDHQVTALVDLGFQDANIRYFQWNGYLGFAHGWFYSVFPAILHPQIWGLPRQFPMSQLKCIHLTKPMVSVNYVLLLTFCL
jgi:hypothetical protein